MKKVTSVLCLLLLLSALLFGCGQEKADPQAQELCFPGLSWNMTPNQAIKALKLADGDYTESETKADGENYGIYAFGVEHYGIFGTDARLVAEFHDYDGNGTYHLTQVALSFSPQENMEAVEGEMIKIFGEGQPVYQRGRDWKSQTPCKEFLTDAQVEYLSGNIMLDDIPNDPLSQINLHMDSIVHYAYYEGERTNNAVYFYSEYSHITLENGYPVP